MNFREISIKLKQGKISSGGGETYLFSRGEGKPLNWFDKRVK